MKDGQPFSPFGLFTGVFIPEALCQSTEISAGAKILFGRLCRYAGQDGRCFPFTKTLAESIGLKERQTQYLLAELETIGLIRRVKRTVKAGDRTSNGFEFLWHPMLEASLAVHHPVQDSAPPSDISCTTPLEKPWASDLLAITSKQVAEGKRIIEESQLNTQQQRRVRLWDFSDEDKLDALKSKTFLSETEWPLTTRVVQQRFQSVDSFFVLRLIQDSVQTAMSCGIEVDEITDQRLAEIIATSLHEDFNGRNKGAGLLLITVPQIIRNRAKSYQQRAQDLG